LAVDIPTDGAWSAMRSLYNRRSTVFATQENNAMPFYEYECASCKFYTEVMQKISDAPLEKCPSCGKKALKKLVSAPVFRLKGGGWYETDFKSDKEGKRNIADREEPASKSEDAKAGESKAAESKPAAESTAKSGGGEGGGSGGAAKPAKEAGGESRGRRAAGGGGSAGAKSAASRTAASRGKPSARSHSKPASRTKAKSTARRKGRR
jgi:putative FmdB family regulatory protein